MENEKKEIGIVVKHTGSHYLVTRIAEWNPTVCVLRGKMRIKGLDSTNPISVGDEVEYVTTGGESGVITEILPRRNYIIRRSTNLSKQNHIIAANIDSAFLIVSILYPKVKREFIDRFLVTCEAYQIPVRIIINKLDLIVGEKEVSDLRYFRSLYESAGYGVIELSSIGDIAQSDALEEVRQLCRNRLSLFAGQSGVGKSSLINALDSTLSLKTGKISEYHEQGKHTTTFYEMHPLAFGGYIVDTPGIKGFGLIDMEREELSHYFPEMLPLLSSCRFTPCTHTHEPDCAVKLAVERGEISEERYHSYLSMLEDNNDKYR